MRQNAVGNLQPGEYEKTRNFGAKLAIGEYPAVLVRWEQTQAKSGAYYQVINFESCADATQRGAEASLWILLAIGGDPRKDSFNGMGLYLKLLKAIDKSPEVAFDTEDCIGSAVHITITQAGFVERIQSPTDAEDALAVNYWVAQHPEQ